MSGRVGQRWVKERWVKERWVEERWVEERWVERAAGPWFPAARRKLPRGASGKAAGKRPGLAAAVPAPDSESSAELRSQAEVAASKIHHRPRHLSARSARDFRRAAGNHGPAARSTHRSPPHRSSTRRFSALLATQRPAPPAATRYARPPAHSLP